MYILELHALLSVMSRADVHVFPTDSPTEAVWETSITLLLCGRVVRHASRFALFVHAENEEIE